MFDAIASTRTRHSYGLSHVWSDGLTQFPNFFFSNDGGVIVTSRLRAVSFPRHLVIVTRILQHQFRSSLWKIENSEITWSVNLFEPSNSWNNLEKPLQMMPQNSACSISLHNSSDGDCQSHENQHVHFQRDEFWPNLKFLSLLSGNIQISHCLMFSEDLCDFKRYSNSTRDAVFLDISGINHISRLDTSKLVLPQRIQKILGTATFKYRMKSFRKHRCIDESLPTLKR